MEFRKAVPADAKDISVLAKRIFPDPWDERSVSDCICQSGAMCYVAREDDGTLTAYVLGRIIPPEGEIYRVAVRPERRRRGVGYRLLDYAMKCGRGAGLDNTFLEVRRSNAPAIALYRAYGFTEVGVRRGYYRTETPEGVIHEDAIVMARLAR